MGWIIALFSFAILCFVFAVVTIRKQKEAKGSFQQRLDELEFVISKQQDINGMTLYVDDKNNNWLVRMSLIDSTPRIFKYSDLIEFEVYEDGDSIIKGRTGSALVGGLAFGIVGAIIGGARSKKIKSTCSSLQVRIRVNDISFPEIVIPFIETETKKSSFVYKNMFESAKQMAATLAFIQNGKELEFSEANQEQISSNSPSNFDEIEKLHNLKEKGVISEEEFEIKKKQLLNL